ncbi:hypothetical protein [Achromobacter sp. RTa]|uniref:hypothetical protein n=1 Tax=Achromobacter sp. RTa TaxID=1532557 RepID=UPI0018CFB7E1|nr:hypothetical protein [Achromobacter sp. RTa]
MTSSTRLSTRRADHTGAFLAQQTFRTLKSRQGRINGDPRGVQLRNSRRRKGQALAPEPAKMRWFQTTPRALRSAFARSISSMRAAAGDRLRPVQVKDCGPSL